jgi:hypothetical protein
VKRTALLATLLLAAAGPRPSSAAPSGPAPTPSVTATPAPAKAPASTPAPGAATGVTPAEEAAAKKGAEEAARAWLALVDAGRYAESWQQASAIFRGKVTEAQWVEAVGSVAAQVGKVQGRELARAAYADALPDAPGTYVILQYRTRFEKLPEALETVSFQRDGTAWKAAGYFVRPAGPASAPPPAP